MNTLTAVRSRTMPRVNLLPPEIAQKAQFRKVQLGLGAAILGVCALIVGAYVLGAQAHQNANRDLVASQAVGRTLSAEQANYSDVRPVYAAAAATTSQLATAMGGEVRTSFVLNDLALIVPKRVWLTTMHLDLTGATTPVAPGAAPAAASVGSLTFGGKGVAHNDVAAWLDALASESGVTSPYFSNSTSSGASTGGDPASVTFAATASLTPAALSHRYTTAKAGN